jgi:hypothetical protein
MTSELPSNGWGKVSAIYQLLSVANLFTREARRSPERELPYGLSFICQLQWRFAQLFFETARRRREGASTDDK